MCAYLLDKSERLKAIENGKGVQYICDEAYKILGNPLLVHDMEYKLLAHNKDAVNDDPIWNEFATNGTIDISRLEFYKNETFFDMVAYAEKVTFLPSDRLKHDRIFGKLFTKDQIQVGCVIMLECDKPFENNDMQLFEIVCDILSEELSESEYYRNYAQTYMETLVGKLIEDSLDNKLIDNTALITSIYAGLKGNIRLAVADISQIDPTFNQLVFFRDLFKRTQPSFKYVIYSNYIVILMCSDSEIFHIKHDLHKLYKIFEQNNIHAGISSRLENLFILSKYYNEAVNALKHGLKTNDSQRIFPY
jgi:hypothetical protein